jgi:uncharacterized membrane protein YidH (DUF202 family)
MDLAPITTLLTLISAGVGLVTASMQLRQAMKVSEKEKNA